MSTPYEQGAEKEIAQGMTITDVAKAAGSRSFHLQFSRQCKSRHGHFAF